MAPNARLLIRDFGRELKDLRTSAGLTQEQLAFKAGLHRTHVSLLERGQKSPTLVTLFHLCAALDIEPSDFVARLQQTRRAPHGKAHP